MEHSLGKGRVRVVTRDHEVAHSYVHVSICSYGPAEEETDAYFVTV